MICAGPTGSRASRLAQPWRRWKGSERGRWHAGPESDPVAARAAVAASGLSAGLVWWFFLPPDHALLKEPRLLLPTAVFFATGVAFAAFFGRLGRASAAAENARRESEHRYSAVFEHSPYAIALTRMTDAAVVGVNDAFLRLFELTRAEVEGRTSVDLGISDAASQAQVRAELGERGCVRDFEVVRTTKSGARRVLSLNLDRVVVDDQKHILTTIRDVTEHRRAEDAHLVESGRRQRAEKELDESEARFRALIDSAVDGIITIGEEGTIESFNPSAERLFGYAAHEVIGENVKMLMPAPHQERHDDYLRRYLAEGDARIIGIGRELTAKARDGRLFPIHLAISEVQAGDRRRFAGFVRDLTEHKELEEQYRHSQKMEAIGTLTTGIAHDFGNLLMGISGCATIAMSKLEGEHAGLPYVRELAEAAKRGSSLTRQLTSFSRKQKSEARSLELASALREAEGLLRRLTGDDIDVVVQAGTAAAVIDADPGQLEQILVNLVVNARDAMPRGGTITIRTDQVTLDDRLAQLHGLKSGGRYATLSVRDTGEGMDAAVRSRVFEPFFTTKAPGKGTGLGLATVYGIATQLGGTVQIQSERGRGSLFTLYLPLSREPDAVSRPPADRLPSGSETVLLVEDETLVRLTVRHYLEGLGYTVVEAREPSEALAICGQHRALDLLLTDVVMPGMGGRDLARRIRGVRPDIRILFMSAHPTEELIARGNLADTDDIINKPFSQAELALAVRAVVDREPLGAVARPQPSGPEVDRRGLVLVVEDSAAARLAIGDYLEELGYRTIRASRATEALEAIARDRTPIDVLLTDYSLPDMKGSDLARRILDLMPGTQVIYMSGYSPEDVGLDAGDRFLQKPIDLDVVADLVATVITG